PRACAEARVVAAITTIAQAIHCQYRFMQISPPPRGGLIFLMIAFMGAILARLHQHDASVCHGKRKYKGGALLARDYGNLPTVVGHNAVHQGEPQTRPTRLGGKEGNEYLFQYIGRDAGAVVLDANFSLLPLPNRRNPDTNRTLTRFFAVSEQVGKYLA